MPITSPLLDDRDDKNLRDELVARIRVYAPEWTDLEAGDPGVTLVELFAFLADTLLWQSEERQRQRRRRHRRRRLALLVVGMAGLGALWRTSKKR